MTTRAAVVDEARSWLDTPYQHQQRMKGVATDCLGMPIGIGRALQMVAPDFDITGYSRSPDGTMLAQCDALLGARLSQAEMQAGDLVVVCFDGDPQHFGILVPYRHGGLAIVHASNKHRKVIETRLLFGTAPRAMKFVAAYRLPGVVDDEVQAA